MKPTSLTSERLLLRPFDERDIDALNSACQDPEIARFIPVPSPYTYADAEEFVLGTSPAGWQDDTMYNFGVFLKESETLVGSMGLVRLAQLRSPQRQAELGFWAAKEHRGRGYTLEAARTVAGWAFGELGVERLEWVAEVGNEASRAVALRLGFVMEGTHRSRISHRGTRRDAWIGALLPSDWGRSTATPYLPSRRQAQQTAGGS